MIISNFRQITLTLLVTLISQSFVFAQSGTAESDESKNERFNRIKEAQALASSRLGFGGNKNFKLNGMLLFESAFMQTDPTGTQLNDGTEIRQAVVNLSGKVEGNWYYNFAYNLANEQVAAWDIFLAYRYSDNARLIFGHRRPGDSFDSKTPRHHLVFQERATLIEAFGHNRYIGMSFLYHANKYNFDVGIFGSGPADNPNNKEQFITSASLALTPINSVGRLVHIGGSYSRFTTLQGVQFNPRPGTYVTDQRLVDTGLMGNANAYSKLGADLALSFKRFTSQAELQKVTVERDGARDLTFGGYYFQFGYFLTPDYRSYRDGGFRKVNVGTPQGGSGKGAVEVAARYSYLSLDDKDIFGGVQKDLSLALNWYPNKRIRFSLNHIIVDVQKSGSIEDPKITQVRTQITF